MLGAVQIPGDDRIGSEGGLRTDKEPRRPVSKDPAMQGGENCS